MCEFDGYVGNKEAKCIFLYTFRKLKDYEHAALKDFLLNRYTNELSKINTTNLIVLSIKHEISMDKLEKSTKLLMVFNRWWEL